VTPDVVVDIGNTRVKWGRCVPTVAEGGWVALPHGDMTAWEDQAAKWQIEPGAWWAVSGVNPTQVELFAKWVRSMEGTVVVFRKPSDLPMALAVNEPDAVGIDRVFGAIAARSMVPPNTAAITVDVGTAVTVNLIDPDGVFQGGGIFPGPALMARSLHEHTAKLPLVDVSQPGSPPPGKTTAHAIRAGIYLAVGGGVGQLTRVFADHCSMKPYLFLTGGGASLLAGGAFPWAEQTKTVPELNLEGIRIVAEGWGPA
jgi:type III pantothenate kinase